eukprot:GHVR01158443.1.p2 GENE.GHVR01158443.1~~GHVR01158443.1.p2  ORF type:complete len:117 (+),score=15.82 GHVR01158443.1:703-1053(+)
MARKLTPRKRLEKKLDKAWSLAIRERAEYTCEKCGRDANQACHIVPRRYRITRWDLANGVCMCGGCHLWWWHENPLEAADWFEVNYRERWEYLHEQKKLTVKYSLEELEDLLEELE